MRTIFSHAKSNKRYRGIPVTSVLIGCGNPGMFTLATSATSVRRQTAASVGDNESACYECERREIAGESIRSAVFTANESTRSMIARRTLDSQSSSSSFKSFNPRLIAVQHFENLCFTGMNISGSKTNGK